VFFYDRLGAGLPLEWRKVRQLCQSA